LALDSKFSDEIRKLKDSLEIIDTVLSDDKHKLNLHTSQINENKLATEKMQKETANYKEDITQAKEEVIELTTTLAGFKEHLFHKSNYLFLEVILNTLSLFCLYIRAGTIRSAAVSIRNRYGPCRYDTYSIR